MGPVLPALVSLAIIDSINPASITGALFLGGSGRKARLGLFILAVYCTYMVFGVALTLGPAAAVRSALAHSPIMIGPVLDVVIGVALVGVGVRIWRRRATSPALAARARTFGAGSALSLGVLTTLADLPSGDRCSSRARSSPPRTPHHGQRSAICSCMTSSTSSRCWPSPGLRAG